MARRSSYDSAWKEALLHYLPAFFEFFFPEIHAEVDWNQEYRFLDKELQAIAPRSRAGRRLLDTLVELRRPSGRGILVLVHIEVQTQQDPDFPFRMLCYRARILEHYRRDICSLAILGDNQPGWQPDAYAQELWGSRIEVKFPVVKLWNYRSQLAELEISPNPFALVVASTLHAHESRPNSEERKLAKLRLVRGLYERGFDREEVLRLIDHILQLAWPQEERFRDDLKKLEESMSKPYVTSIERMGRKEGRQEGLKEGRQVGLKEGRQVGLKEGRQVGMKEGHLQLARRMLEAGYPLEEVLKLTELSAEELSTPGVKSQPEG